MTIMIPWLIMRKAGVAMTDDEAKARAWDIMTEVLEDYYKRNNNRLSVIGLIRQRERILKAVKEENNVPL